MDHTVFSCAIPECLWGVFTTRRYTNPLLPTFTLPLILPLHLELLSYSPPKQHTNLVKWVCGSAVNFMRFLVILGTK